MTVIIDAVSAARLLGEGAMCFDTDTSDATCDELPVRLPSGSDEIDRPVLVCGSSDTTNVAVVAHLQDLGLPAWQVVMTSGEPSCRTATIPLLWSAAQH